MTTPVAPIWTRVLIGVLGTVALVVALLCFLAPGLLLGIDAYRSLTRASLGLFGATLGGLGTVAMTAARDGSATAVRSSAQGWLVLTVLATAVVIYNIGAFSQTDTTGIRAFGLAGGIVLGIGLPSLLILSVLHRLRRSESTRFIHWGRERQD